MKDHKSQRQSPVNLWTDSIFAKFTNQKSKVETVLRMFLQNWRSWNFHKIHKETTALESLLTLLKSDSSTSAFLWILRNFKNTYFVEHLRATASMEALYCRFSNMWPTHSCSEIKTAFVKKH